MARKVEYKKFNEYARNVTQEDFRKFVGKHADAFESTLQAMSAGELKTSYSVWGVLFFPFYAAYYKQWLILLIFCTAIYTVDFFVPATTAVTVAGSVAFSGMFKRMYVENAYKKIDALKRQPLPPETLEREIIRAGKAAWWGPLVALVIMLIFVWAQLVVKKLLGKSA